MTSLVVDDGIPARSNRNALLSDRLLLMGMSQSFHKMYSKVTVILFATRIDDFDDQTEGGEHKP